MGPHLPRSTDDIAREGRLVARRGEHSSVSAAYRCDNNRHCVAMHTWFCRILPTQRDFGVARPRLRAGATERPSYRVLWDFRGRCWPRFRDDTEIGLANHGQLSLSGPRPIEGQSYRLSFE